MKTTPWLLTSEGTLEAGRRVVLEAVEARHARGALRLETGMPVVLTNGAGSVASGRLVIERRGVVEVAVETVNHVSRPSPGISLAVAILAGPAMDMVVQKAVELGVDQLVPVWCARSQLSLKRAATRMDHWLRISRQALKQCRREWAMELAAPMTLVGLLGLVDADRGVVADPCGGTVEELHRSRERVLLIGPEGGFSPEEDVLINESGWSKVRLGNHVLRAETAAIAGVAILGDANHRQYGRESGLNSTDD
jgi:16S rRNA (uracil1498-N3)-methyltransferase